MHSCLDLECVLCKTTAHLVIMGVFCQGTAVKMKEKIGGVSHLGLQQAAYFAGHLNQHLVAFGLMLCFLLRQQLCQQVHF